MSNLGLAINVAVKVHAEVSIAIAVALAIEVAVAIEVKSRRIISLMGNITRGKRKRSNTNTSCNNKCTALPTGGGCREDSFVLSAGVRNWRAPIDDVCEGGGNA